MYSILVIWCIQFRVEIIPKRKMKEEIGWCDQKEGMHSEVKQMQEKQGKNGGHGDGRGVIN